jgi:hypothetical protein
MEEKIKQLGWVHEPWLFGGWIHDDVRDNDGDRRVFDNVEAVARYEGIEEDADAQA